MELVVIMTLLCVVIWVFFCCLYIPYRDESRYIKAELRRSRGAEHRYWQRYLFELRKKLLFYSALLLFGYAVFLFFFL